MVVDMLVLYILVRANLPGWNLPVCKLVSAELALVSNFCLNSRWTFRGVASSKGSRFSSFLRFNAICLGGMGISNVLLNTLVHRFGFGVLAANFIAIVLASVWNYALSAKFAWKAEIPNSSRERRKLILYG